MLIVHKLEIRGQWLIENVRLWSTLASTKSHTQEWYVCMAIYSAYSLSPSL